MEPEGDSWVYEKLDSLRKEIEQVSKEHTSLSSAATQATALLDAMRNRRDELLDLNRRLSVVSAESAELLVDLEEKNKALNDTNKELANANAHAAELMGEIEIKNSEIEKLNTALSHSNAQASELLAELELSKQHLEEVNGRLEAANKEKSHLLGVVAHDLRSGLGGIQGMAEVIKMDVEEESSELNEQVGLIVTESTHMLELLSSLLEMSSFELGKIEIKPELIDFNLLVKDACAYHSVFAEMKKQSIHFKADKDLPEVSIDPLRMRQAIDNLLSNAIKYSYPGEQLEVHTWFSDGNFGFSVKDGGPGLTEADFKIIFKPFQKLSATPTGGEESHGLGLAITQQLIDRLGGKIWAENCPQGGCRFQFQLPIS
jgi:signal transduction histidine kinase